MKTRRSAKVEEFHTDRDKQPMEGCCAKIYLKNKLWRNMVWKKEREEANGRTMLERVGQFAESFQTEGKVWAHEAKMKDGRCGGSTS